MSKNDIYFVQFSTAILQNILIQNTKNKKKLKKIFIFYMK